MPISRREPFAYVSPLYRIIRHLDHISVYDFARERTNRAYGLDRDYLEDLIFLSDLDDDSKNAMVAFAGLILDP